MIKRFLTNNIGLKLLSILLGFVVWLVVVNISNPEVTASKQLQIDVINENVLTSIGKTYEFKGTDTVTVSYRCRTTDQGKIRTSDFRAFIDLNNIYDVTSSIPVNVEVVSNRDLIIGEVTVKPAVMHIEIEDTVYKAFNIGINTVGEPLDGYSIGSIAINPTTVQLSGPASMVENISSAAITIDISGVGSDTSGSATIVYYDVNGNLTNLREGLKSNRTDVDFYISTLGGKSVPVQFSIVGQPMDGYSLMSVDSSIKEITVMGSKELLDSFGGINVPAEVLDITGLTESKSVEVDLRQFVPEGLTIVSNTVAIVTARIEARNERAFNLTWDDFVKTGLAPGNTYSMDPAVVTIVIGGDQQALNQLTLDQLKPTIDCSQMQTGIHTGAVACELANMFELKAVTNFNVIVNGGTAVEPEEQITETIDHSTESTPSVTGEESSEDAAPEEKPADNREGSTEE